MTQIKIAGYKQNCYRVAGSEEPTKTLFPNKEMKSYHSLEKVDLPTGFYQELVQKDYPITSASVSSLAEGADYRNDPLQAIAQAPQRVNLGDITEAQKFLENPQNYARIFEFVKGKMAEYEAQQQRAQQLSQQQNENQENGGKQE